MSCKGIFVRPAQVGDLPAMRTLFLRSRLETFVSHPGTRFQLQDFDLQTQGEQQWVAEEGAQLVGFISLWAADNFIHHIYVDQGWTRRGVGRALLRALPGWPTTRFQLKCLRLNEAALAFYRACHFVETGTGVAADGEYVVLESAGSHA
ncbi:putative acetyltransferase [compost metagenome]